MRSSRRVYGRLFAALVVAITAVSCDNAVALARRDNVVALTPRTWDPSNPLWQPRFPQTVWNRVLADTTIQGDLVLPAGQQWLIGRNVQVAGNVLVQDATLAMRPGSSLKFLGADPSRYVGSGMQYTEAFKNDIGLWVWGSGQLDISCTPKTGWNRTGVDPTWAPNDEYYIAPTAIIGDDIDKVVRRWTPGQPIPQVDPRVPAAEVVNVTRDCSVTGPGHIHVHSTRSQRVEYLRLERMGIIQDDGRVDFALTGRYALHFHMSEEGTRGSIIRGVACVNAGGRCFVPHTSHGVTMIDNVAVNGQAEGFWWDDANRTNDLVVDRLAVLGVLRRQNQEGANVPDAIALGNGINVTIKNSVAAGADGVRGSADGFDWTGGASPNASPVWNFNEGNVAHNNNAAGIKFWTNSMQPHQTDGFVTYRNGRGIENGAYQNANRFSGFLSFQDGAGIDQHTSPVPNLNGQPPTYERCRIIQPREYAINAGGRQLEPLAWQFYIDCVLEAAPGAPKVIVGSGGHPWRAHFIRSGVTPDDIGAHNWETEKINAEVLIDHEDGRKWRVVFAAGRKTVTSR